SNTATTSRTGTMTIAGQTFTLYLGAAVSNVLTDHIFYDFIGKLSARGFTQGCGGGNFCPDDSVTREQMATFIVRGLGEFSPPTPTTQLFPDVPSSNIFYNFIERLAARGIALNTSPSCSNGTCCAAGSFCPGTPVT